MHRTPSRWTHALVAAVLLQGCGRAARLQVEQGTGPQPVLPPPAHTLLPLVHVAPAVGWREGHAPVPAASLAVNAFARGLEHPRWLCVLPNGDVLVAESNAPQPHDQLGFSPVNWARKILMRRAGAGVPSPDRITLLRDTDGDGVADVRSPFLVGLHSPFGMALVGNTLYVADTDALLRFPYSPGAVSIDAPATTVLALPAGPVNHHWTKNVIADPAGARLFVTVGSNSNVGENGLQIEDGRAAIWEVQPSTGGHRIYATGLRNPNGMAWEPRTGALWTVVNERDELGSDLVPDYLATVHENAFYGWPFSYFGQHADARAKPPRPDLVSRAVVPDYALGPHTASLGLAVSTGNRLGDAFAEGMFIGQHGSWNRKPFSGYKVIFVPFSAGRPAGAPLDVLTGFIEGEGKASGRPVGVAVDSHGALLVADDVGNTVWRVSRRDSR